MITVVDSVVFCSYKGDGPRKTAERRTDDIGCDRREDRSAVAILLCFILIRHILMSVKFSCWLWAT